MKKVHDPELALFLEQIPNIGKAIAKDLNTLNIKVPTDLKNKDPYLLYVDLCNKTKSYHDPCVLDTFMAAINFMNQKGDFHWWNFTKERKQNFSHVENQIKKWKSIK